MCMDCVCVLYVYVLNSTMGSCVEIVMVVWGGGGGGVYLVIVTALLVSGQVLRCDVFVDAIVRIEITTRTRELLLEEEPERFELRAFDNEGMGVAVLTVISIGSYVTWFFMD